MDEPLVGLDRSERAYGEGHAPPHERHGATVFMSSHDLGVVQELCRRMAVIFNGEIVAVGTLDELRAQRKWTVAVSRISFSS